MGTGPECEAFWRSHHEAWRRSDLNQREYCEAHGLVLKRFENWRSEVSAGAGGHQDAAVPTGWPAKSYDRSYDSPYD
jgi:hypothetical protein